MSERISLPLDAWPARDRAAWEALFVEGDVLGGEGSCTRWSDGGRRKRLQSYSQWLGFLSRTGGLEDVQPGDRITPETVAAFYRDARARSRAVSARTQIDDLSVLAERLEPGRDWSWLRGFRGRLHRNDPQIDLKPRPGVSASKLFERGLAMMQQAEVAETRGSVARAVDYRDGLMIALLIARPVRLRAFIALDVNRRLIQHGDGYRLRFRAEDMKDRRGREYDVPRALVEPLRHYLDLHRLALARGRDVDALWLSRIGGPLAYASFQRRLADLTGAAFGEVLRPHRFRHVAATSIAEEDPAHVNIVASILGHATLDMAEKHYNRASGVKAAGSHHALVRTLRKTGRRALGFGRRR